MTDLRQVIVSAHHSERTLNLPSIIIILLVRPKDDGSISRQNMLPVVMYASNSIMPEAGGTKPA